MPKLDSDITFPPYKEATKEIPDRPRNALLVFVMSIGSGLTVMIATLLIIAGIGGDGHHALVAGGVATLFVWAWWLFKADALVWTIETVTGHDLNRDGAVGEPPRSVSYDIPLSTTQRIMGELSVSDVVLREWCRTAINGGSLAYRHWEPRFQTPTTSGRDAYAQFRAQLVGRRLAVEKGSNVGLKLTRNGYIFAAAFAEMEESDATPLLDVPDSSF